MWSIVAVFIAVFSGAEAFAVTDLGVFKTEQGCKAALATAVTTELNAEAEAEYEDGYRRFICVRVAETEPLANIR
jgi:hypothetical protein